MKTKLAITISLMIILSLGVMGQVFAQTRVAGVGSLDYFIYSITAHWQSNNASEPVPDTLIAWNLTKQYKVSISGIDGTNVTSTQTWDFTNGTETPYLITIDIESGTPYYLSGTQPPFEGIVGANLTAGDLLHPTGTDLVTINQTITRNYASGPRLTNVVDLSGPIQNQTSSGNVTIGSQDVTFYIDKATGVLVEQDTTLQSFTPTVETASVIWNLRSTNVWNAASPTDALVPTTIIIVAAVVVIIVVAAAMIFRPRRPRHRRRQ